MPPLIDTLKPGPLDIIGDVHGEIDVLDRLLQLLGYSPAGVHPEGRHLVFVGDLTDRGPDSPAVVRRVADLVNTGRAQCVLGNHDLNLLLGHRKHDNDWFYGETQRADGVVVPQALADDAIRRQVLDFFGTLPVALERQDLRVVHACWDDEMISVLRHSADVVGLYQQHFEQIETKVDGLDEVDRELLHQNRNPVKLLTSGPEMRVSTPFVSSGKKRFEKRVPWWNNYHRVFCVFGHYSIRQGQPRGGSNTYCVDYGIGKRWTERRAGERADYQWRLAAFRWPEQVVVLDP